MKSLFRLPSLFPKTTETEFVAAFDVLLRNHKEFVPPQHFFERLTHVLLRRREDVKSNVRDDDDSDSDSEKLSTQKTKSDALKKQEASLIAREDDRLLRATAEVFRKVNKSHPCAFAARFPIDTKDKNNSSIGKAHVRVGTRTWTPLDSDRRAGTIRVQVVDHENVDISTGAFARGSRADWSRFYAMVRAARGDMEPLEALIEPKDNELNKRSKEVSTKQVSRSARANARNAYADAEFNLDKDKKERTEDDSEDDEDVKETPLGVCLLLTHAVDVLVQDADARIAVFESRVEERNAERAAIAQEASAVTPSGTSNHKKSSIGIEDSPVPDSQPDNDDDENVLSSSGAWAVDLLRNSLLYRLFANHAPSDTDRTRLFLDLLELAGQSAKKSALKTEDLETGDGHEFGGSQQVPKGEKRQSMKAGDKSKTPTQVKQSTRGLNSEEVADFSPGREDTSVEAIGVSAISLLNTFDELLSTATKHSANWNDRSSEKLRTQLDDSIVRFFRTDRKYLRKPGAKKKFLEVLSNSYSGQNETRGLRVVRGALREKVTSRRAPGIMRPGLGITKSANGAVDVFNYVAADAKDAIKAMEFDDSSVRRAEACDTTAHFLAAAAKAAVRMIGREGRVDGAGQPNSAHSACQKSFSDAATAFSLEASGGDALTAAAAAVVDCANGILTV